MSNCRLHRGPAVRAGMSTGPAGSIWPICSVAVGQQRGSAPRHCQNSVAKPSLHPAMPHSPKDQAHAGKPAASPPGEGGMEDGLRAGMLCWGSLMGHRPGRGDGDRVGRWKEPTGRGWGY